jgi:hypothetical protein
LRKPVGIVLSPLFLAAWAFSSSAQQHPGTARVSRLRLIIPFENTARISLKLQPTADAFLIMARLDLAEKNQFPPHKTLTTLWLWIPRMPLGLRLKRDIELGATDKATSQHP